MPAPSNALAHFEYRRLGMADLPLLNRLYNAFYRKNRPLEEAIWLYGKNPNGSAVIYAAFDAHGELAGMRPSIPFKLWWRGAERTAYEFADALVDPRYQRRGIFSRLLKSTCAWAEEEGHTLFSLPNENSLAVYRGNASLHTLGDSCTVAKPLSWGPYLHHQLTGGRDRGPDAWSDERPPPAPIDDGRVCLRPIDRFDSDFADVRRELRRRRFSFTLRRTEFLQWRYFGSPVRRYRVALVEDNRTVRGYVAIRMISRIAHIVDFFVYPDADLARRVFGLVAAWAKKMGAIGIHFSSAGNACFHAAARQSGYLLKKRPRRLVVNSASIRVLSRAQEPPVSVEDVYFVMGDFDFL